MHVRIIGSRLKYFPTRLLVAFTAIALSGSCLLSNDADISKEPVTNTMAELAPSPTSAVVPPADWSILQNENGFVTAWVGAVAKVPGGTSNAFLRIQCAKTKEYATGFSLGIDSRSITSFVDDFEGPDAPALKHKLGLMVVSSGNKSVSYPTALTGWYGNNGFEFSPAYYSGKRYIYPGLIAKAGNSVRFIITSLQDHSQTIDVSFPAIAPGSDIARQLARCQGE